MKKQIRCAIYTRKSTEEGLEQDFNSLDAQREACEAYIKSQKHEGWILVEKQYNDGGYSGGTMERPAFQDLLNDIQNDEIDIVVVYKVDRLTRSLMDFSKIIDIFDKHETSFVSITQQFNTTTSMGRLTLNILLSFAQFEREVTGERIRDKFAASRKKGLWLTGKPPYGYYKDKHHMLHKKQPYADNVKRIFEIYLEEKNVRLLSTRLKEEGIFTENGKEFSYGNLYNILSRNVYIGKLGQNGKICDGVHEPLVSEEIFNAVRAQIKANRIESKHSLKAQSGSLLSGLAYDDKGNKMIVSNSNGAGKRYRYYVSQAVKKEGLYEKGEITKIRAGEIEKFVIDDLLVLMKDQPFIQSYLTNYPVDKQSKILEEITKYEPDTLFIREVIKRVDLAINSIKITYNIDYIVKYFNAIVTNAQFNYENDNEKLYTKYHSVRITMTPQKHNKIIIPGQANYDIRLIQALVKSFWYNKLGAERKLPKVARNGHNKKLRKLRFLPPDIIESIMNGTQDPELNVKKLIAMANEYVKD